MCDPPVLSVADLRRAAHDVEQALVRRGMGLRARVVVKLRSHDALTRSGLFCDPDQLGVTTVRAAHGRRPGSMLIALSAGLPATTARMVLAHEYGHALLFDRMAYALPGILCEGFAEFVAFTYLTRDEGTPLAATRAEQLLRNPDPLYGGGLRLIRDRVDQHGFAAVWAALTSSDPAAAHTLESGRLHGPVGAAPVATSRVGAAPGSHRPPGPGAPGIAGPSPRIRSIP